MYSSPKDYAAPLITSTAEPMALGSPTTSPANPTLYGGSQYLPNFLMGDTAGSPANNSRVWGSLPGGNTMTTTPRTRTPSSSFLTGTIGNSSPSPKSLFSPVGSTTTPPNRGYLRSTSGGKHGGPPVQGLFDHTTTSPTRISLLGGSMPSSPPFSTFPSIQTTPVRRNVGQSEKFPMSPAQIDPFYTQGRNLTSVDDLDETWITVFGFPPTAASYILQQFYHYGTIIEHKLPTNGNWMHIRYQTKLQAKIALSKNGKVFGNNYMVGVAPCIDKNVMNLSRFVHKDQDSPPQSVQSFVHQIVTQSPPIPISSPDFAVLSSGTLPQKRTGLFSKAMEYVFGW